MSDRRAIHSHGGVVDEWEPGLPEKPADDANFDSSSAAPVAVESVSSAEPVLPPKRFPLLTQELVNRLTSEDAPDLFDPPVVEETNVTETSKKLVFKSKREKWIFGAFIIPPLAISFISMMHMVSLFETSNLYWMAVAIAVSVELAAMSSLVALVTLDKLNKTTIWSIFGVLATLQILGNMYHTFVNMSPEAAQTILNLLALDSSPWSLRLVNFIVGGILPVIALTFVKGIVDYFKES